MAALYLCVNNPKGSGRCRGEEGKTVYLSVHHSVQARKTSGFKIYFHLFYNESIVNTAFIVILCHVFKCHILSKVTCELLASQEVQFCVLFFPFILNTDFYWLNLMTDLEK